jgi:5-aminopentanamidase
MKLALWQTRAFTADVAANLAALDNVAQQARAGGAALLVCPECWLGGYNIGAQVSEIAEAADGPAAQRIAAIARRYELAIAYGYAERAAAGTIFNSVQVVGPQGTPLGHYRKTHLFGPDERTFFQPGTEFAAPFAFAGLKIGLLICYDVEFPESVRTLALLGADLILVPTALTNEYTRIPEVIVPARSLENQVFVAYCNRTGRENGMRFLGRSCITGPDGHALAAAFDGEALLFAQIRATDGTAAAQLFPYRDDRRPELYGRVSQTDPPATDP